MILIICACSVGIMLILICKCHLFDLFEVLLFLFQTVSLLEQRLTMTEDKLRECLDSQQKINVQLQHKD